MPHVSFESETEHRNHIYRYMMESTSRQHSLWHNILLVSYVSCGISSSLIIETWKRFWYLYAIYIYLLILHPNFISARFFFCLLSSLRSLYKEPFCSRWLWLKNGVLLLTSYMYIPKIAVALFIQFFFMITNNKKRKCCSRNEKNTVFMITSFIMSDFVGILSLLQLTPPNCIKTSGFLRVGFWESETLLYTSDGETSQNSLIF